MKTQLAKFISYAFHPLLLPTYGMLLFFQLNVSANWLLQPRLKFFLFLFIFLFTFMFPLLNVLLLLRYKLISSLHMPTRQERRLPLLITAFFYGAAYYLLHNAEVSETLSLLLLGATLSVIVAALINLFWKISMHMLGFGALVGVVYTISYSVFLSTHYLMTLLFLIAALIAYSRLQLSAHNSAQVYAGFAIGFISQLILFF